MEFSQDTVDSTRLMLRGSLLWKKGSSEGSMELFCEDLLIIIMSKLSEKDLIKCKCVSKEWHTIISHVCVPKLSIEAPVSGIYFPFARIICVLRHVASDSSEFLKTLLFKRAAFNDSLHFMEAASLKVDGNSEFVGMSYAKMLPFDHHGPDFLDCCNGLLLFVHRPKPLFYVCNPAINQCVPIPLPPSKVALPSLYASLAFDPSESIHYRIVISSLITQPQCLHIFCSQTGDWMTHEIQVKLPDSADGFRLVRHCVYLQGMLYRLSWFDKVLCFDLEAKTARIYACPGKEKHISSRGCFGVLAGSLSFAIREYDHLRVWLLDKQSEQGEWILKYEVPFSHIHKISRLLELRPLQVWLHPCAFHPKSNILFLGSARSLLMYHLGTDLIEKVRCDGMSTIYCSSFLSMFTYARTMITLKNWCKNPNKRHDCEAVLEDWCFTEQ